MHQACSHKEWGPNQSRDTEETINTDFHAIMAAEEACSSRLAGERTTTRRKALENKGWYYGKMGKPGTAYSKTLKTREIIARGKI
ncbi:hypothetical protein [Chitinophaga arvensicola]|uniref:Uncharacterized protein n=1 Tax=Chitinophaga arvensicola TaxID=29529 RepID=A0A1I0SCV4_9BACT|nr:hypothetical protein [Chitinophaga arvensicola]SEW55301.1 hypothetical protein SAMN04488122_6356 [Chitinophaga arvensicola]